MDIISTLLGVAGQAWDQFKPLSNQQKQQNAFNASEAQKGRDFSAQQAELERDWQEEMYAKYNSMSGKIEQAQQAGVNPLYAVTGSASTPMSASPVGVSSPTASDSGLMGGSTDLASQILSMSKIKAEIDQMEAYTREANGKALLSEIDAKTRDDLNQANIADIMQTINQSKADEKLKLAQIGEVASKILNTDADTKIKTEQLGLIGSQIANTDADTNYKIMSLQEVASRIQNLDADTDYKSALTLFVGAQTKNERLMSGLITQNTHLSRSQRREVDAKVKKLYQDFDHDQIMYSLEEVIAHSEADHKGYWDASNYSEPTRSVVRILRDIKGLMPNFSVASIVK